MGKINIDSSIPNIIEKFNPPAELGFGKTMAPVMLAQKFSESKWGEANIIPYAPLNIDPAAKVLHYAQEIFEGLKAYKNEKEEVFLFRPDKNAKRFNTSARRMAMPEIPEEDFIQSCVTFSKLMKDYVPKGMNQSLYLRPFMIATEATLGVKSSSEYLFLVIGALVESYFPRPSVRVYVEEENCRAAPGGVGAAKTGANYGASLLAYNKTLKESFDQTLWLDAIEKKYIEELSGMNFFAVIGDELVTPALTDTILAGITRDSILGIAEKFSLKPVEKKLSIIELVQKIESKECREAFACGTASVLTPIECIGYKGKVYELVNPQGKKSQEIKEHFLKLQRGLETDSFGWTLKID